MLESRLYIFEINAELALTIAISRTSSLRAIESLALRIYNRIRTFGFKLTTNAYNDWSIRILLVGRRLKRRRRRPTNNRSTGLMIADLFAAKSRSEKCLYINNPRPNTALGIPKAAMCVRNVDVHCVCTFITLGFCPVLYYCRP